MAHGGGFSMVFLAALDLSSFGKQIKNGPVTFMCLRMELIVYFMFPVVLYGKSVYFSRGLKQMGDKPAWRQPSQRTWPIP